MSLLGKLFLHGVYQPWSKTRDLWRDGGRPERKKTAAGMNAMAAAAARLPALPAAAPDAPEIHLLTGKKFWFQSAFLLTSLHPHQAVRVLFHSDGTLDQETWTALRRIVPTARLEESGDTEARLERILPTARFPRLRARRAHSVLYRKLLDVHVEQTGWTLFLDSDQLALRRPEQLLRWLHAPAGPLHMTDLADAYGCPRSYLDRIAGRPVPAQVNTGILGVESHRIDWEFLEHACGRLDEYQPPHYYHEQALTALLLARAENVAATAPHDYVVGPGKREGKHPTACWHHYVAQSKRWYYQRRWQAFSPDQPSQGKAHV